MPPLSCNTWFRWVGTACLALALAGCAAPGDDAKQKSLAYPPPPEKARYYYERTLTGSNDVVQETATDRLRRFATGESSRGKGFAKPFEIVAHEGRVFVSDTVNRRVAVLDFPRKRYYEIGTEGIGRLAKPLGIAVDGGGRIYVCDGTARRVQVYDLDGNYIKTIGSGEVLQRPSGLAVNVDGTRIYVVDTGGVRSEEHVVRVFDQTGAYKLKFGARGGKDGEFNLPLNVAVAPDGSVYVVDTGNFRIQHFSAEGKFLNKFGAAGRRPGQFSHPKGISIDRDGNVFVSDTGFANFQIFDKKGQLLLFVGERSGTGGPGEYLLPAGISVDVDGRIYMIDQFFRKVDVFRPATLPEGTPIGRPPLPETPSTPATVKRVGAG
jgi:sugar lactone lactonase YvrE